MIDNWGDTYLYDYSVPLLKSVVFKIRFIFVSFSWKKFSRERDFLKFGTKNELAFGFVKLLGLHGI